MQSRPFALVDLVWLFQQSCADCGVSSAQGYFLDVAKLGHWIHSGHNEMLIEQERVVGAIARRKDLARRISQLNDETVWTLALGFASPVRLPNQDGIAIPLLGDTNAAKTALRQMRLAPVKPAQKPVTDFTGFKFKAQNRFESSNTREFVAWLFATSATKKQNRKLFEAITNEARAKLDAAIEAFCATGDDEVEG